MADPQCTQSQSPSIDAPPLPLWKRSPLAAAFIAAGSTLGWLFCHAPPTYDLSATPDPRMRLYKLCAYLGCGVVTLFLALAQGRWFVLVWFAAVGLFFNNLLLPAFGIAIFATSLLGGYLTLRPRAARVEQPS